MSSRGGEFKRNRRGENRHRPTDQEREDKAKPPVDESNPVIQAFLGYQRDLDKRHDKYERLVKLSRDVTIDSKRTIFLLHRINSEEEKGKVLEDADGKLSELRESKWREIACELHNEDPYQFMRAYSPGLQEYIEAVSFHHYLKTGGLISVNDVQKQLIFTIKQKTETTDESSQTSSSKTRSEESNKADISQEKSIPKDSVQQGAPQDTQQGAAQSPSDSTVHVHVDPIEYMLGLADLTGELMRMAVHSVGTGDLNRPYEHCNFMRMMHDAFVSFGNVHRELPRKLYTLKQSLRKVEAACYALQVRGSEIPKHMLVDVFTSSEREFRIDDDVNTCSLDD